MRHSKLRRSRTASSFWQFFLLDASTGSGDLDKKRVISTLACDKVPFAGLMKGKLLSTTNWSPDTVGNWSSTPRCRETHPARKEVWIPPWFFSSHCPIFRGVIISKTSNLNRASTNPPYIFHELEVNAAEPVQSLPLTYRKSPKLRLKSHLFKTSIQKRLKRSLKGNVCTNIQVMWPEVTLPQNFRTNSCSWTRFRWHRKNFRSCSRSRSLRNFRFLFSGFVLNVLVATPGTD